MSVRLVRSHVKDTDPITRRTALKITGIAGVTTALAGCGGPGGGGNETGGNGGNEAEEEPAGTGNETETGTGDENESAAEEDENESTEEGNESAEDGAAGDAIEPDTEIMLEGTTQAWMGVEPEPIADEENPTLTLQEGESYEITWENGDGAQHNLVIWDDSEETVDDYETDMISEEGETATLEIDEVTDEMAQYVCEPHSGTMVGDIELASGGGGGDDAGGNETDDMAGNESDDEMMDNESGNETDANESDENESEE